MGPRTTSSSCVDSEMPMNGVSRPTATMLYAFLKALSDVRLVVERIGDPQRSQPMVSSSVILTATYHYSQLPLNHPGDKSVSSSPREEASATGVEDMLARPDINSQLREAHERGLASLKDDLLHFVTFNETIKSVKERGSKVTMTEKQDGDYAFEKLMV